MLGSSGSLINTVRRIVPLPASKVFHITSQPSGAEQENISQLYVPRLSAAGSSVGTGVGSG